MEPNGDVINGEVRLGPTNAFQGLHISSSDFLNDVDERMICSKCFRSRKYFCYTCYMPMDTIKDKLPRVHLPVQIDIIKYPKEVDGKSTATHATILAPDKTTIYTYPNFPDFQDKSKVLIVFPGKNSVSLEDLAGKFHTQHQNNKCRHSVPTSDNDTRCLCTAVQATRNCCNMLQCNCDDCKTGTCCLSSIHTCNKTLNVDEDVQLLTTGYAVSEPFSKSLPNTAFSHSVVTCSNEVQPAINLCSKSKLRYCSKQQCCHHSAFLEGSPSVLENVCAKFNDLNTCQNSIPSVTYAEHFPYERVIFIDSTWNQVHKINNDERLKGIQRVEIKSRDSLFWRFQRGKPRSYLATIEAIYYFLVDMHMLFFSTTYSGEYDNLLFFFRFMYDKIHNLYGHRPLRAYSKNATKNPPHKMARLCKDL